MCKEVTLSLPQLPCFHKQESPVGRLRWSDWLNQVYLWAAFSPLSGSMEYVIACSFTLVPSNKRRVKGRNNKKREKERVPSAVSFGTHCAALLPPRPYHISGEHGSVLIGGDVAFYTTNIQIDI